MELTPASWSVAVLAALIVGASKSGVPGGGILAVALFAQIFPARESTGALLPVLIVGDLLAVTLLRQHVNWPRLWRLFPWTAAGILLGVGVLAVIDDAELRGVIGGLIVAMTVYQLAQRFRDRPPLVGVRRYAVPTGNLPSASWVFTLGMGLSAGVTTMVANAAGPFTTLYLLAMRLDKLEFVGTTAWFFLAVNLFKLPFAVGLGLISWQTLQVDLLLAPAVGVGALWGRWMLRQMDQALFERLVLGLALLGGLRLLF
ncbi:MULTISPECIES: sulfite exporter TauE/SafE family protein [unclassified Meiothermus]|uniref:sulfite exporter TauE/SafE family protein n=1 Tax=unclassified Meiothermus TaxID=370471 RepID=UPI000D7D1965|nr:MULTISPECIES: sulfite exporter TauE/SafE family protein [unclassified Meiothermus]PZA08113.1 sulfite exporter TauE/SafE family protein [Meiothermus sp. Pnk-1]RYM29966.1 sulfite exporter TauE/SafE family protein [Meiothermus sp. PNK-Is4]